MKSVGIKNLKNNLSRYLDLVREGETVYVTDRDDIIAEIHKPVTAPLKVISRWEAFLNAEERNGSLARAKREKSTLINALSQLKPLPGARNWKSILDESREDRF